MASLVKRGRGEFEAMRIAAAQMTSTEDREENLRTAEGLVAQAKRSKARLIAFPENFSLLTEQRALLFEEAQSVTGPVVKRIQSWATRHRIWIQAGTLPIRTAGGKKVTNTALLISPQGRTVARYDKIHLFDVQVSKDRAYRESKHIQGGSKLVVAQTPLGKMGLSVCYDVRFPELYRKLADRKTDLAFIPSAFTRPTGQAHWDVLTRARAIENQMFVIASAQTGFHYKGRKTWGHTRIIDPWGRILVEKSTNPGLVYADLDLAELKKIRREMPVLTHRKLK